VVLVVSGQYGVIVHRQPTAARDRDPHGPGRGPDRSLTAFKEAVVMASLARHRRACGWWSPRFEPLLFG
jgi:hypothetical protein